MDFSDPVIIVELRARGPMSLAKLRFSGTLAARPRCKVGAAIVV